MKVGQHIQTRFVRLTLAPLSRVYWDIGVSLAPASFAITQLGVVDERN